MGFRNSLPNPFIHSFIHENAIECGCGMKHHQRTFLIRQSQSCCSISLSRDYFDHCVFDVKLGPPIHFRTFCVSTENFEARKRSVYLDSGYVLIHLRQRPLTLTIIMPYETRFQNDIAVESEGFVGTLTAIVDTSIVV